jgi:hypothetical protein
LAWDLPQTVTDSQKEFLEKFSKELSPQLLLQSAEANKQWLSAEAANELIRLLYFQSLIPGKSLKVEQNHIDTVQDLSIEGFPSFAGLRISTLSGYLKASSGWIGVDLGAGVEASTYSYNFAYGDSTPQVVASLPAPCRVVQVAVIIDTPFNGTGAAFSVGDAVNHSRLMSPGEIDLSFIGTFYTDPGYFYSGPTDLNIYITPGAGASAGSGEVIIYTI